LVAFFYAFLSGQQLLSGTFPFIPYFMLGSGSAQMALRSSSNPGWFWQEKSHKNVQQEAVRILNPTIVKRHYKYRSAGTLNSRRNIAAHFEKIKNKQQAVLHILKNLKKSNKSMHLIFH
jgi:hypothetical protein